MLAGVSCAIVKGLLVGGHGQMIGVSCRRICICIWWGDMSAMVVADGCVVVTATSSGLPGLCKCVAKAFRQ